MLIRYPTSFYKPLLPAKPSDAGDVTFTISSKEPPRPKNASVKVPAGIAPLINRKPIPRAILGDLVFTVNDSSSSILLDSTNQYVLGDILEFGVDAAEDQTAAAPTALLEIRHDLVRIDYEAIGLSANDISILNQASADTQEQLRRQLNQRQKDYENNSIEITNTIKSLNEATKTLQATQVVLQSTPIENKPPIQYIITKLVAKIDQLDNTKALLVIKSTVISSDINDLIKKTRSIGVVVS